MEKKCNQCNEIKLFKEFSKNSRKKDGLQIICKKCIAENNKNYYELNKKQFLLRNNKHSQNKRKFLIDLKVTKKCQKCSEDRHYCLCFHHIDPSSKTENVSSLIGGGSAIQKIKDEINKCIILCQNCHYEFHYLEKEKNITIQEYLGL